MSVPRGAADNAQRDQSMVVQQQPPQTAALSTTVHIPSSHAFLPLQQLSFTPTHLGNPADDNNNKAPQLPVVSVVAAVPGLCGPALSMRQAVAPTIIPTVMAPLTVHAAVTSTTMPITNTLNIGNQTAAAQQQYQALGSAQGLNLMTNPALNLASSAVVASAISNLNSNILVNSGTTTSSSTKAHSSNNSPPNHPSSPLTTDSSKTSSTNLSPSTTSSNSTNSSSSTTSSSPARSNNTTKSSTSGSSSTSSSGAAGTDTGDDLVKPVFKDGDLVLEVECGQNKGILYLSKLCQGSKGPCISFQTSWLTPNEFQFVSGRETAKDWKRSIRHHGKSLKLLLAKGILNVHPTMCDCDGCRQGATLTRKGEKRRIPNGDRKPRKPSGGGNSGNGNSSGHAGTTVGAGVFRPAGKAPALASHLTSPGAAPAKPEVQRSGGDKQVKLAAAESTQSPDPESVQKASVLSQEELKSQASAYLDSFNMLGAHKVKSSTTTPSPALQPLELTTATSTSTPGETAQAQISPALSASSTSSQTGPASPGSEDTAARETEEPEGKSLDLSAPVAGTSRETETSSEGEAGGMEVGDAAEAEASSTVEESDEDEDDNVDKKDDSAPQGKLVESQVTSEGKDDTAARDEEHSLQRKSSGLEESNHKAQCKSPEANPPPQPRGTFSTSGASVKHYPYGISAILGPSFSSSVSDATHTSVLEGVSSQPLSVSMSTNNVKSEHIWVPPTLSPAGQPRQTSEPHTSNNYNNASSAAKSHAKQLSSPSVPSTPASHSNHTAQSVSERTETSSRKKLHDTTLSPNKDPQVSSHKKLLDPTLSSNKDPQGFSHGKPHEPNLTHRKDPQTSSNKKLHDPTISPSKDPQVSSHRKLLDHSLTSSKDPQVSSTKKLLDPTLSPRKDPQTEHHSAKSTMVSTDKTGQAKREQSSTSSKSGVERERDGIHPSSATDPAGASRERDREDRQRQRAREERTRKDREREERRERERREEKEAERMRQEEKERRGSSSETGKPDDVSAAAPSLGGPSSDPSRRPPGGLAEAAAFSDYMRVLASSHGQAMMPSHAGYLSSLYGMRPQDSQHMAALYGAAGISKESASALLFPGPLAGFAPSPLAPLHPLLAARPPYAGAGPSLLDYQRSMSSSTPAGHLTSPYAAWPTAYPYLLPDLMAASSSQAAAGFKRHSSEMEAAMELSAKRMRLDGRPPEFTSPWDYFAAAAAASQQQQHHHQQQQHQQQQQQRAAAAAAFAHSALSCGLESASFDKSSGEYLRKRYLEYATSNPHAAAYLSTLPEYARTMSVYGQAAAVCPEHRDQDIRLWGVEDVCKLLTTLDGCGVYVEHFREQRVDGRILSLLSSEHLVKTLGMKLGPALLLAEAVAKRLQDLSKMASCENCRAATLQTMHSMHPMMSQPSL